MSEPAVTQLQFAHAEIERLQALLERVKELAETFYTTSRIGTDFSRYREGYNSGLTSCRNDLLKLLTS